MKLLTQEPAKEMEGEKGLNHLSDEQVLPLLLVMDPDTLLNFGKTSERFFNLVCDREVWRHLLKKTAVFTKEKVEQLKAFMGSKGSKEMMPEMVEEAACRIPFSLKPMPVLEFGEFREDERWDNGLKNQVKVTFTVGGGWSNNSFEVDCNGLEKLSTLARATDVKLILVAAKDYSTTIDPRIYRVAWNVVIAHMEQQEVMLEQVKFKCVGHGGYSDVQDILPLLRRSYRWEIENIEIEGTSDLLWTELAKVPTSSGHICSIFCFPGPVGGSTVRVRHLNILRNLWDICKNITTYTSPIPRHMPLDFLGGKVCILDPEAEWRRVLNSLDVVLSDIMGTWDLSKDLWSDD